MAPRRDPVTGKVSVRIRMPGWMWDALMFGAIVNEQDIADVMFDALKQEAIRQIAASSGSVD